MNQRKQINFDETMLNRNQVVVFSYLMDLFIFEEHQGNGLATTLVKHIVEQPDLQVRLWFLGTADAHGLYKKFGFSGLDNPDKFMFKRDENYC